MSAAKKVEKAKSTHFDNEVFLQKLGGLLKKMRKAAGFSTIRSFTDAIDISYSQYQGYESGKNITLTSLKRILKEFNFEVADWLNLDLENDKELDLKTIERIRQARIEQLIEQVKINNKSQDLNQISTRELSRYIDILIFCSNPKGRKEILVNLLEMDDSINTLKRVAGKLIDYGWLSLTDSKSRNNPNQKYVTTTTGKKILRIEK